MSLPFKGFMRILFLSLALLAAIAVSVSTPKAEAKCPTPRIHFPEIGLSCLPKEEPCNELPLDEVVQLAEKGCREQFDPNHCPLDIGVMSNGDVLINCEPTGRGI